MKERVEDLIAEFVSGREDGVTIDLEQFIGRHPEVAAELRQALFALRSVEAAMPDRSLMPGRIGDWVVDGELGRGGMGRVLAAHRGDQRAAIKLLNAGALAGPRTLERLQREGETLVKFEHPQVVRVLEIGSTDGAPWIAMELVDGPSLAERIATARKSSGSVPAELALSGDGAPAERAARLVAQLAHAVHAAHEAGLLHRDLKPANVLLRDDGSPVLIDFGLAADDSAATLTRSGDVLGTPNYMSPEQARGEPVDRRTDVRGLGAILIELLTLSPPFPIAEPLAVMERVRREPVRIHKSIRGDLRRVLARALAFTPSLRYPTAKALAHDLESIAMRRPVATGELPIRARLEDFTRLHRVGTRAVAGMFVTAIAIVAIVIASRMGNDEAARIQRVRELRAAIADAWLREDQSAMKSSVVELAALEPTHPLVEAVPLLTTTGDPSAPIADLVSGARALARDDGPAAVEALERAASIAPEEPLVLVMLGRAAEKASRTERAAEVFSAAIHVMPRSTAARRALALLFRGGDRLAEAEATLVDATRIDAQSVDTWIALCDVRLRQRNGAAALDAIERGLAAASGAPSRALLASHAAALDAVERWDEAHAVFRELLAARPGDLNMAYTYAYSLDRAHRMVEARALYAEISAKRPNSQTLHAAIAWLVSGASTHDCEQCRSYYAEHPELLDADEAERRALEALRCDRGRTMHILETLVKIVRHLDRRDALRDGMKAWLEDAHQKDDDDRILQLTKALRLLDAPL